MEFLKGVFAPGGADREHRRQLIKEMHEKIPDVAKIERGKYSLILRTLMDKSARFRSAS